MTGKRFGPFLYQVNEGDIVLDMSRHFMKPFNYRKMQQGVCNEGINIF
jgi:hypothetical protein